MNGFGEISSLLAFPLAIVCHDAGGANHVIAWLKSGELRGDCRVVMEGPARKLWVGSGLDVAMLFASLDEALCGSASLISGTGWGSSLEHDARALARKLHLPSIAVLDHWVNYTARFERRGETILPDELWVTDEYAYAMAEKTFPVTAVHLMENVYLNGLVKNITQHPTSFNLPEPQVLYVLEPIRSDWGRQGSSGEFQALDYFIKNIALLGIGNKADIVLRPHPSDAPGKYDEWILSHRECSVRVDSASDLANAIACAQYVVGCHTYAMVVALAAGKIVVSSLPPWAPPCSLPHSGILKLASIAAHANS